MDYFISNSSNLPSAPVDWKQLHVDRKEIKKYLKSLDADAIGKGLTSFDEKNGVLYPRTNFLQSSHKFQWVASIGTQGSTFEAAQKSLLILGKRVERLRLTLTNLFSNGDVLSSREAHDYFFKVVDLKNLIKFSAKFGLGCLSTNYRSASKEEQATSIDKLGNNIFDAIETIWKDCFFSLSIKSEWLKLDQILDKEVIKAGRLFRNRKWFCEELREVCWAEIKGVQIPNGLFTDIKCHKKAAKKLKLETTHVENAALEINLSGQAGSISSQGKSWIPVRPQTVCGNGVIGTYKDEDLAKHLCNLYYKIDPVSKKITISSGAMDSSLKAQELAELLLKLSQDNPQKNNRWVIHQPYSFQKESGLIRKVRSSIRSIEPLLQSKLSNFTLIQINTTFNTKTNLSWEDAQSLIGNVPALAQLSTYVQEDLTSILEKTNFNFNSFIWTSFAKTCKKMAQIADEIKQLENNKTSDVLLNCLNNVESEEEIILSDNEKDTTISNKLIESLENSKSEDSSSIISASEEKHNNNNRNSLEVKSADLTKNSKNRVAPRKASNSEIQQSLLERQEELKKDLNGFITKLQSLITYLGQAQIDEKQSALQSLHILRPFMAILETQLKPPETSSLSRINEIEYFLMLYRLLNIRIIVSCDNGLDRTGTIVAIDDALSQFEQFLEQKLSKPQETEETALTQEKAQPILEQKSNENSNELLGSQEIKNKIVTTLQDLIKNLDPRRKKIFSLTNQVLLDPNLRLTRQSNLRNLIMVQLQSHGTNQSDILKHTLYYLELVANNILNTQLEKTFYSTGVFGLKYQQQTGFHQQSMEAHDHPIERLPQFIFSKDGIPAQLIEFKEGWLGDYCTFTENGNLFNQLSDLRKF